MEQKTDNTLFLTCCDHSVSGEFFNIRFKSNENLLKTEVSLSEAELQRYYETNDYISHSNQKQTCFERIYFAARELTQYQKLRLISRFKPKSPSSALLDFGAGVGHFVHAANRQGWQACGVEISQKARTIANTKSPETVFPLNYLDTLQQNSQTIITMWHVLEHLKNPDQYIKQIKPLLRKDGRLIVAVPNFKSYDAAYFASFWAAYDVPRHLWHFSQNAISELFERHDMEVESTHPMWLDAFYVSLISTKYKFNSMKLWRGLWVGLVSNLKAMKTREFSSIIYVIKHQNN